MCQQICEKQEINIPIISFFFIFCQTLGLVLRLRVDFVFPLSQEQEEQEE